jgi:hypothetical protein
VRSPETADAWIAAWETKAAQDGLERGAAYRRAGSGSMPDGSDVCDLCRSEASGQS